MPQPLAIAIIGAGPAGLTVANVLQRHGWRADIFEADAALGARDQGGSLDLHPGEGQLALHKAGLFDAFMAIARHEDQEQRLADHATGELLREEIPEPGAGDHPEIDRVVLRELLLQRLAPDTVRWGVRLHEVVARPDGRYDLRCQGGLAGPYDLRYQGGLAGPYDLVVGADGAWSKVRAALTPVQPAYTGVTFVELWLTDVDRRHPEIARRVGHGTYFSMHGGAGIVAQRNGNATLRVYAAIRTSPEETDRPDLALAGMTREDLLARFPGWAPSLLAMIRQADRIAALRPIVALPPGTRWPHRAGLTLVGDAAHVMPPLGVGVNLAMLDAAELAEALVGGDDWRAAQQRYEVSMLDRAAEIAAQCAQSFEEMFEEEGGLALQAQLDAHRPPTAH